MLPKTSLKFSWLRAGYLLLALVAMYFLITQLGDFKTSFHQFKHSVRSDDVVVLLWVVAAYLLASLTYYFIALKRLKYFRTVVVELAINVINRLVPAGLGGLGANYIYLTKSKHTKAQAGAVVAANTIIGIVANLLLLGVLVIYFPSHKFRYASANPHLALIGLAVVLVVALVISLVPTLRSKLTHNLKIVLRNLGHYKVLKLRLAYGLLCQLGLCLANVLALFYSLKAVHAWPGSEY